MSSGGKLYERSNRSSRYNPLYHKKQLLINSFSENYNTSLEDEDLIPCYQNQSSRINSPSTSSKSNLSASICSVNLFQSTPISQNKNGLIAQSKSFEDASRVAHDDDLSVSTLDNIFNTSFNDEVNAKLNKSSAKNVDKTVNSSESLSIFDSSECGSEIDDFNETIVENNRTADKTKRIEEINTFYGLPLHVKELVRQYKGINQLYDWQNECLTLPAVKNHKNLIYALPTSGGKTLVAEILMLKEILCKKKNVLFILPFVSIVQEKVWALSPFAVNLDFLIEEYAGGKGVLPPRKRRQKKSIYIATIEKALMLIRSLIESKRLDELGLVVIDELHLLGDPSRGTILEMLLTNILYCEESIQIIGMSATIGNIDELAKFINAEVFMKDFRPVELKEYIKIGSDIYSINYNTSNEDILEFKRKVNYKYSIEAEKIDGDHLSGLVMEVIPNGSCLIFCPTKKNCENVANVVLRSVLPKKLLEHRKKEKDALKEALRIECEGKSSLLDLVEWGIAYHHAGLVFEERRLVEEAFRNGVLNVLCCTSTLAAGVNLPAQRVILRAPLVGKSLISLSMYKQMVGRAGRAGYGGHGDSIMICPTSYLDKVKAIISSPMENVNSNLHGQDGAHMKSFVLGSIASDVAATRAKLRELLSRSLLSVQAQRLDVNVKSHLDMAIKGLIQLHTIEVKDKPLKIAHSNNSVSVSIEQTLNNSEVGSEDNSESTKVAKYVITRHSELSVSKLGKAAVRGCFSLYHARCLYADLKRAQECLVLTDILHLLYLVTPYDIAENIYPVWSTYKAVLERLNEESMYTVRLIGFSEYAIVRMASREIPKNMAQRVFNRFYVTLMLHDLWNNLSLQDVSDKYGVSRGIVQSLMEQASSFCSNVMRFCEELDEFWAFKDLLFGFSARLSHCCIQELLPLMELPNVKKNRAMQLYKAGFKTLKSIALSDANILVDSVEHLPFRTAKQLIATAKLLLLEKVENLREQAQEFMDEDLFAR